MPLESANTVKESSELEIRLEDALLLTRAFAGEVAQMLKKQGLPVLQRPGEFPDISRENITELSNKRLNQLQAEFVNAAAYVNNRLAIARVEGSYQKYLIKIRKSNMEVRCAGKKPAEIKRLISIDPEVIKLESGKEYLDAIGSRYKVYYDLYTANQAVLSREQTRRGGQFYGKIT